MSSLAEVKLWGSRIGAVSLDGPGATAVFEYDAAFARSGIEISPLVMPLPGGQQRLFSFPDLPRPSFHGLPGLLADSLPDRFGNALIDQWLATQGRTPDDFDAVERLCYTGTRGMGALEFEPAIGPEPREAREVSVAALVALASNILSQRGSLAISLGEDSQQTALSEILRVGTSAGGARAKAVIAWNPTTHEVRSGQIQAGSGFEHWILKFDGVTGNRDKELADPKGYGLIEYAYYEMALAAGIEMSECRILAEGGRNHFLTRRFDRLQNGDKLHMQSLAAIAHYDFNAAGAHSYEQALQVIRQLHLPMAAVEQQFRRMVFNVVARNHDDHVKNIAFLMDREGQWSLSPAFDVTYAFNPSGDWTVRHQMTIHGKLDAFTRADLRACANTASMKRGRADAILEEVIAAVSRWPQIAASASVPESWIEDINTKLRLELPPG